MNIDYYSKLFFLTLFLIIHLFFNNCLYSSTQINFQNSDMTIDSLLLAGDLSAVRVKYDHHEYEYYSSEELEALFRNVDFATTLDLNSIDDYVAQYKTLAARYYIEYAGEKACIAYEKFLQLSNQIVKSEALKFYYISSFFKIHHHNVILTSARNRYREATKLSSEKKYSEALESINGIKIISGQNSKLIAIEDSLELLHEDIFNQQIDYNRLNKTGLRTYKLFLGIIPSIQYYGAVSDVTLKIENAFSEYLGRIYPSDLKEIHIRNLPSAIQFEISLGVNYLIFRKLMIGLDVGYTAFSMNSDYNDSAFEDKIYFEFKLNSTILHPYIKYLFSEEIGVSPFITTGIGYQMIEYDDGVAGRTVEGDHGDIDLKPENRIGVICEIGVDYMSGLFTKLLFGSKVGGYYFFKQSSVWDNYNITFSVYAGLIL